MRSHICVVGPYYVVLFMALPAGKSRITDDKSSSDTELWP